MSMIITMATHAQIKSEHKEIGRMSQASFVHKIQSVRYDGPEGG